MNRVSRPRLISKDYPKMNFGFAEFTDWQNHIEMPCCCSKRMQAPPFDFFRHWFHPVVFFTRKNFQFDSGLLTLSISGFQPWPRLRVVGSCIRSVVVILPVGSITPVGIRNFDIPGNPGSPDWHSVLRLPASSGFGSVNSSVTRFAFPAVCRASAIVGISHSIALRFCMLRPYMMSIIGNLLQRGS
jgi:hypothetical protein